MSVRAWPLNLLEGIRRVKKGGRIKGEGKYIVQKRKMNVCIIRRPGPPPITRVGWENIKGMENEE